MEANLDYKVFFYTCPGDEAPVKADFQDLIVNLADGFERIGIQFFSSCNYWRKFPDKEEYLLKFNQDISPQDCDVVVLERQWFGKYRSLPQGLFDSDRKYITVYLDCQDGINNTSSFLPEFRKFDFVFKTHYIKRLNYPKNVHPWAFGLSTRVLNELKEYIAFSNRKKKLLVNYKYQDYGKSYRTHALRKYIGKFYIPKVKDFLPIDSTMEDISLPPNNPYHYLMWLQTGKRHHPPYYERLRTIQACAAFGGFFSGSNFFRFYPPN